MVQLLYLDACVIQRPMDPVGDAGVEAEAACIRMILQAVCLGRVSLASSDVLEAELLGSAVLESRRVWSSSVLGLATHHISLGPAQEERARELSRTLPLAPVDALHVACAEHFSAPLVTVDRRRFLDRVRRKSSLVLVTVVDPFTVASWLRSKRKAVDNESIRSCSGSRIRSRRSRVV